MKLMVKHGMVNGIPRVASHDGVCEVCVLVKNHHASFEIGKA
jgi:hypothetical protein